MKSRRFISCLYWLPFLIIIFSCSTQLKKEDFIGKYNIDRTIPVDTTSKTILAAKQTANWTISLEEHNNFVLAGNGKNIVGYWDIEKIRDKDYRMLLQGGGMAIFGRFDGTSIYFDKPYRMFDSLFSEVSFTNRNK